MLLRAESIVKRFPGVTALKGVSFDLRPGEIHALCGENGAGKSTLIKLLSGIHPYGSYEGELFVGGRPARFHSIADAEAAGIAVICQELALVPEMTAAENIFLGVEPKRRGLIDWPRVYRQARELLERFGLDIDPHVKAKDLGAGRRQLLEIVKALRKESKILILDEPTSALTETETEILLGILKDLRKRAALSGRGEHLPSEDCGPKAAALSGRGEHLPSEDCGPKAAAPPPGLSVGGTAREENGPRAVSCIYISHKLSEVFAVADRITVLRDGASVTTLDAARTDQREVIRHMVGRDIEDLFPRRASKPGQTLLRVSGLDVAASGKDEPFLKGVSFEARAGEVLGIGGLMGAGRTELLMHIFGAWGRRLAGSVELKGRPLKGRPEEAIRRGLALVCEDRRRYGLVLGQSIGFNLSLASISRMTRLGLVDRPAEEEANARFFSSLRIKAPGRQAAVAGLSGGNQQKVVLGKALMTEPSVIFLDEPTRGIDVGAKLEVYEFVNSLTEAGKAVVLVSSELPELMGMSDRILMLHEGEIAGEFSREEAAAENLLAAAMGHA